MYIILISFISYHKSLLLSNQTINTQWL